MAAAGVALVAAAPLPGPPDRAAQPDVERGSPHPDVSGKHDAGLRRKATRAAREKGCSIYIPAEILRVAGIDPEGPTPYYRTWAAKRGSVLIRLYREP